MKYVMDARWCNGPCAGEVARVSSKYPIIIWKIPQFKLLILLSAHLLDKGRPFGILVFLQEVSGCCAKFRGQFVLTKGSVLMTLDGLVDDDMVKEIFLRLCVEWWGSWVRYLSLW